MVFLTFENFFHDVEDDDDDDDDDDDAWNLNKIIINFLFIVWTDVSYFC
jgi:hypothetical protein